jgi:adenosine deaminase CECR1
MLSYAEYQEKLKDVISSDGKERFDCDERNLGMSTSEALVSKVMELERESIIGNKHIYKEYLPVTMFYDAKTLIDKTITYKILRKLPKGGNLHIHSSSTWDAEEFIKYLTHTYPDNVYIQTNVKASDYGTLKYWLNSSSIKKDYKKLTEFIGNDDANLKAAINLITFNNSNMSETDDAWDTFNTIFSRVSGIIKVKDIYKEYYKRAFQTSYEDNVKYLEIRMGMGSLVDSNDPENSQGCSSTETLKVTYQLYEDFRKAGHSDFKCKLIISTSRSKSNLDEVVTLMQQVVQWKRDTKDGDEDFIVGFDFVSEEDVNFKTDYYAKAICDNKIDLNFYFHDGESNWADDDNVMSAWALGTQRIGHGLNLYRFPDLLERIKKNDVCLEVCPISNQLLKYTTDLRVHPIGEYMKRGVPVTICSDDPQIFGNKGLTYDFWEVYFGQQADLYALRQAICNSYKYSALPQNKKSDYIDNWRQEWNKAMNDLANNDLLYCAAMFENYYDEVKAEGGGHSKKYSLNSKDLQLWKNVYYKMVLDTGKVSGEYHIKDGEFFGDIKKNANYGVGADGVFYKVEYCNFMYQIYKYLYERIKVDTGFRNKQDDISAVKMTLKLLESYTDKISNKGVGFYKCISLNSEHMDIWKKQCYPKLTALNIPDGTFFGDVQKNANYGVGADGAFYPSELLHLLYQCYKFLFFNHIYE